MKQRIERYELVSVRLRGSMTHAVRAARGKPDGGLDGLRTLCGRTISAADGWKEERDGVYGLGRTGCGNCLNVIYGAGQADSVAARKRV